MQMLFWKKCKCNFHDADVPYRDADTKFIHDDASARIQTTMQMSSCRDGDAKILWCKCHLMGMPWCKYFDANIIYSKIPFIFKTRLPQRLKSKYFQNLIYYSWKVKMVITVRNLRMRHRLGFWWSGSKDLFSQFGWAKGSGTFQRPFFEKRIL